MNEDERASLLYKAILETQSKIEAAGTAMMREITQHTTMLKEAAYKVEMLHMALAHKKEVEFPPYGEGKFITERQKLFSEMATTLQTPNQQRKVVGLPPLPKHKAAPPAKKRRGKK